MSSQPLRAASDTGAPAHWIPRAEAALNGESDPDVEVIAGGPPPLLDAYARRVLLAPLLACFLWSAGVLVEQMRDPLDASVLLLRLFAACVSVRSALGLTTLLRRLRVYLQRDRYALALCDEGLLLRTPHADIALPKSDIVDVQVQSMPIKGRESPVWAELYLVTKPHSGRSWLALPPVFARLPSAWAQQLADWRGEVHAAPDSDPPSSTAIEAKRGLPSDGPYTTMLLGAVLLASYTRLPEPARERVAGWVTTIVVSCWLLIPALWLLVQRWRHGPRHQPVLTIDAERLTLGTTKGPKRIPWSQVTKIDTLLRSAWSLLRGAHETRALSLGSFDGSATRLGEDRLSLPVEVACALCDAYRHGRIR